MPSPAPPPSRRSPLDGTTRLIVDGTNLLYRLGAGRGRGNADGRVTAAPPAAIIGRLRAAIPAAVTIDLVFDGVGHGVYGRVAQGMHVRYAGRRTADDVILDLASEAAMTAGPGRATAIGLLVVTNDRMLREQLALKGARTASLQWLMDRLDLPRTSAPAPGNRRPPAVPGSPTGGSDTEAETAERPPWKPGRGATTKTGPARRVARHRRHPRHGG